ncbi:MAG: hypothetical protein WBQ21_06160 [Solirubrobacteraceae bacterium]
MTVRVKRCVLLKAQRLVILGTRIQPVTETLPARGDELKGRLRFLLGQILNFLTPGAIHARDGPAREPHARLGIPLASELERFL